jgi:hypothetical protein
MINGLPGHLPRGACRWAIPSRFVQVAPPGAFPWVAREVSLSLRRRLIALILVFPLALAIAAPVAARGGLGDLTPAPKTINFGKVPVYSSSDFMSLWIYNSSKASVYLLDWGFGGRDSDDFNYSVSEGGYNDCVYYQDFETLTLAPGESCVWYLYFAPGEAGGHSATFWNLWYDGARSFTPTANLKGSAIYEN